MPEAPTTTSVERFLAADDPETGLSVRIDTDAGEIDEEDIPFGERKLVFRAYRMWCAANDETPLGKSTFFEALRCDPRVGTERVEKANYYFPNLAVEEHSANGLSDLSVYLNEDLTPAE